MAIDIHVLIVKGFENLLKGEDDELKAAYAHFRKMVDEGSDAVGFATLQGVSAMHTDVKESVALAGSTDQYLKSTAVFPFKSLHFSF